MLVKEISKIPKYVQVANIVKKRINQGQYVGDSKLPSVRSLGAELGVSVNVVQRALRVLEQNGAIALRHGVEVRVLSTDETKRTPLMLGLIYPIPTSLPFSGSIHQITEAAIDVTQNHCVIKSSNNDPAQERQLVEQFLNNGIEGLLIWPCEGLENTAFFQDILCKIPLVFVDRTVADVPAPSVTLDYAVMGRDIVVRLAQRGYGKILILETPLEISSYQEMYTSMRETVDKISARDRFDFVQLHTEDFLENFNFDPIGMVDTYRAKLEQILKSREYEAMFSVHDEFIDYIYACTDLHTKYPVDAIVSTTNTFPTPRSLEFYKLGVLECIFDFEAMIRRAGTLLHDKLFLKSRKQGHVRVKPTYVTRTSDSVISSACRE